MKKLSSLYYRIFKRYRRLEVRCVPYSVASQLIAESEGKSESEQWDIAKEENHNPIIGWVYLERKERIL